MAILKIYKYPADILRTVCTPVAHDAVMSDEIQTLISDMTETMYACEGAVGLAANQVGATHRIFIMDTSANATDDTKQTQLRVFINPEVTESSRKKSTREGCLSFPEFLVNTKRATRTTVTCLNEHGEPQEYKFETQESVAVQHEIDHLDGVLMIDRVNSLKSDVIRRD